MLLDLCSGEIYIHKKTDQQMNLNHRSLYFRCLSTFLPNRDDSGKIYQQFSQSEHNTDSVSKL